LVNAERKRPLSESRFVRGKRREREDNWCVQLKGFPLGLHFGGERNVQMMFCKKTRFLLRGASNFKRGESKILAKVINQPTGEYGRLIEMKN